MAVNGIRFKPYRVIYPASASYFKPVYVDFNLPVFTNFKEQHIPITRNLLTKLLALTYIRTLFLFDNFLKTV